MIHGEPIVRFPQTHGPGAATKLKCIFRGEFADAIIKHMGGSSAGAGKKQPAMAGA